MVYYVQKYLLKDSCNQALLVLQRCKSIFLSFPVLLVIVLFSLLRSSKCMADNVIVTDSILNKNRIAINLSDDNLRLYKDFDLTSLQGLIPKYSGCSIVQNLGDRYKVVSGELTGFVSADGFSLGEEALETLGDHASRTAVVQVPLLHVYEDKECTSVVTVAFQSDRLRILEEGKDWLYVDANEYYCGYVEKDFVRITYEVDTAFKCTDKTLKDLVDKWIREERRKAAEEAIAKGDTEKYQEIVQSDPALGTDGIKDNKKLRKRIVAYALQFVGNPYVWGGTSLTHGCDCSGFVQGVYKHFGFSLSRTSYNQVDNGKSISVDKVQPGDLFFYMRGSRIGHVSMYIGDGKIVHARGKAYGIVISPADYDTPCAAVSILY